MPLRVMTWNISYCKRSTRIDEVASFIKQNRADIVLLQEIAPGGSITRGLNQPAELARRTGLAYHAFGRDGFSEGGEVGNAVLSRYPLDPAGTERFVLPNQTESSVLKTKAVINGLVHHIYTTHPRDDTIPPNTESNLWLAQRLIVQKVTQLDPTHVVILGGDLNVDPLGGIGLLTNDGQLSDTPAKQDDSSDLAPDYFPDEATGRPGGVTDYVMYRGPYRLISVEHRKPYGNDLTDHAWHVATLYEAALSVPFNRTILVPESSADVDTGIDIEPGQHYELQGGGRSMHQRLPWPGDNPWGRGGVRVVRPAGLPGGPISDPAFPLHTGPNAYPYSLIGRFGITGEYFYIGAGLARIRFRGQSRQRLYLRANDDTPGNGSGEFTCRVVVSGGGTNNAAFVQQRVPPQMEIDRVYNVSVTMRNTGNTTWMPGGSNPYRLGSQNPQDNSTWGLNRVELPGPVAPGAHVTFSFSVEPPAVQGNRNFQWRMVQELVEWFGDPTPNVSVRVVFPTL